MSRLSLTLRERPLLKVLIDRFFPAITPYRVIRGPPPATDRDDSIEGVSILSAPVGILS